MRNLQREMAGWKSAMTISMERFVMIVGMLWMHELCVINWDTTGPVSCINAYRAFQTKPPLLKFSKLLNFPTIVVPNNYTC